MPEHTQLAFTKCVELANAHPDFTFCRQDLPWLERLFEKWLPLLLCEEFEAGGGTYICIYFPEQVETEIAEEFRTNPSLAWGMSSLAWIMLRLHAWQKLGTRACLPLPRLEGELLKMLAGLGLCTGKHLVRAYAILTFFQPEADCRQCALQSDCPKNKAAQRRNQQ